ncbi:recombinase [Brucella sp. BE17]|uniref:recombinase n=1 Tax=Brucella sp. BE17 TaxID=3142977 RepID=UPI0031BA6201
MPTLTRLLAFLGLLAAITYGAIYALANFVKPQTHEMSVEIPATHLKPLAISPKQAGTEIPGNE